MNDSRPGDVEKMILGYEELEAADKAEADRLLGLHPELAARLNWHRDMEAAAAGIAPVADFRADVQLSAADEAACRESLHRILSTLELVDESGGGTDSPAAWAPGFQAGMRRSTLWILPLAALLAVILFLPRGGAGPALLRDISLCRIELMPDGSRGPAAPAEDGKVLHTGEAFALDFSLEKDAYVVVYHVGPTGQVTLVYPESVPAKLHLFTGGRSHRIPEPDSDQIWVLGAETGTESFLLASSQDLPQGLDELEVDPSLSDRDLIRADLQARLLAVMDQVDLFEFQHVD